ncbi:MAG: YbhB/YbcL family Raf kinase inhibitor-like protein [Rhodospirillaceae bacterium]|nr:YbhB/YbcL family Raf kinase inhibitor-like protein [Rhodospirillaceae bacterium]
MKAITCLAPAALAVGIAGTAWGFEISSPDVPAGGTVPDKQVFNSFGCTGGNVSPALAWKDAPEGTKSFAITMYDPDAPTGSGWWHWVVFNIPASVNELKAGAGDPHADAAPEGAVQSMTDFGTTGYGGPCPPEGDKPHRYIFTVYALKVDKLPLDAKASGAMIGFYLNANALGKASFEATYGR